jgi:hypothetical protein
MSKPIPVGSWRTSSRCANNPVCVQVAVITSRQEN